MALIFPASPTLNQTYVSNGVTWTWQGAGWGKTSTAYIADGSITTAKIADLAVTSPKLATAVTNSIAAGGGPKISSIVVTDSSYTSLDDTAVSSTGGYIKLIGTGFAAGCTVTVGTINATTTTYVSATEVRAQLPATSAGSYTVYLSNTDGGAIFKLNGVIFSAPPVWTTGSYTSLVTVSTQLLATGDSTLTYTLTSGSLPSGITLSSSGLLSGTTTVAAYSFTVTVTDAQLQDVSQVISLTVAVPAPSTVEYLVAAGGGAGSAWPAGGGGGGGGVIQTSASISPGTAYTVTVGAGCITGYGPGGGNGSNSSFIGTGVSLTAIGGGGGGAGANGLSIQGVAGGSGGGGGYQASLGNGSGGAPTAGQGNAGGSAGSSKGGGGGGAGGAANYYGSFYGGSFNQGNGGDGVLTFLGNANGDQIGSGGGGGGAGSGSGPYGRGGGSGAHPTTGGTDGVVAIRYADTYAAAASTTGSPTITTAGGYRVYKWTSSGSITF